MFRCLHVFGCSNTPICSNNPHMAPMLPVHLHELGVSASAYDWGMLGSSFSLDNPPCVWMPPHVSNTSMILYAPLHVYVLGLIACAMGEHPICWGLKGGFSTSVRLLVSIRTSIGCPLYFVLNLSCSSLCLKSLLPPL